MDPRSESPKARSASREKSRSRSPEKKDENVENTENTNLYVANISYRTEEADLEEAFQKFGKLSKCSMIKDPSTGESRGFAFITFEDARDAKDAIAALDGSDLGGRSIRVEVAKRSRGHDKTPGQYLGPSAARSKRYDDRRGGGRYDDDRRGGRGYDDDRRGGRGYDDDRRGGRGYDDRRRGYDDDRRRGYDDDRGRGYDDRGRGYDDRGRGYDDRRSYDRRDRSPQALPIIFAGSERYLLEKTFRNKKIENMIYLCVLEKEYRILQLKEMQNKIYAFELIKQLFYTENEPFMSIAITPHEMSIVVNREHVPKEWESKMETMEWKSLQITISDCTTSNQQLDSLQKIAETLATAGISVLQISTYQTDYVLVKCDELENAVYVLESKLNVQMEENGMKRVGTSENRAEGRVMKKVEMHRHTLSFPQITLQLYEIEHDMMKLHMHAIIQLLFCKARDGNEFVSYTQTNDEISLMTSDETFRKYAKTTTLPGIVISPDDWKLVQVGDTNLGFAETGIVASQADALAKSGTTTVFYVSTYSTDFVMIKREEWEDAVYWLRQHFNVVEGSFAPLMA